MFCQNVRSDGISSHEFVNIEMGWGDFPVSAALFELISYQLLSKLDNIMDNNKDK